MLNRDFVIPTKESGPSNCIAPDSLYYGNLNYTWNFSIHFPVVTIDYAENNTGVTLSSAAGSTNMAEANLLKIAKLSRTYIFSKIPMIARKHLEYRIAHDEELIQDILNFQIEILQTWGGYESLYRVTDSENQKSIGKAAEEFIKGIDIWATYYVWNISTDEYRNGY
jgi:hypothetical protein